MNEWTPQQAEDATADQRGQSAPIGTGLAGDASGGSAPEVDVSALIAQMQAQQAAMAEEIRRLKMDRGDSGEHPAIATARSLRDQVAQHVDLYAGVKDGAGLVRLADDVVDAAGNAVSSGDPSTLRGLAARLARRLDAVHPGGGDHHYINQALAFARSHLPDAADTITEPQPSGAVAVGSSSAPVKVLAGSVTG